MADIDSRYILVGAANTNPIRYKEVGDTFDYQFDFLNWLLDTETLTSATVAVSPAGPTCTVIGCVGTIATVKVVAGTTATKYVLTIDATISPNTQHKITKLTIYVL